MRALPRSAFLAGSLAAAAIVPQRGSAQALTPFRATSAIDDAATPYLYAMENGIFRKNGFDATLERATSGAAAASAVVGGSFDVGKSSVISLLTAHSHGLPIVAISAAGDYDVSNPAANVVVRPDSSLRPGTDLNGKTIAVSAINDSFSISVRAWVDKFGGDSTTVKLLELPMSSVTAAITAGRIDAAVLIQPFLAPALAAGTVRSLGDPVSATGNHHTDSAWFTTVAYTQKNPDAVNRFMRIIRDAAIYVNGHHAETAGLLTKFAMVQSSDVGKIRVLQGWKLDPANLQPLIDAAARYKFIPDRFDAKDLIYPNALR
jgi:NitT/TauT family transport system substrate-binding protein